MVQLKEIMKNYFTIVSGIVRWIKKMPEEPKRSYADQRYISAEMEYECAKIDYNKALQQAIDTSEEVENQKEVLDQLWRNDERIHNPIPFLFWKENMAEYPKGTVYSLECSVEKEVKDWSATILNIVVRVTFDDLGVSGSRGSEDELWAKVINDARFYDGSHYSLIQIRDHLKKYYKISANNPKQQ